MGYVYKFKEDNKKTLTKVFKRKTIPIDHNMKFTTLKIRQIQEDPVTRFKAFIMDFTKLYRLNRD